jgi:hypothetical protein
MDTRINNPNALGEVTCFWCKHLIPPSKYSGEQFGCKSMTYVMRREKELQEPWKCSHFEKVDIIERIKWTIMGII